MPFDRLRETLLARGFAPRHVRRYLTELRDHLDDLTQAQRAAGYDREDAEIRARARLGEDEDLLAAMLARPDLRALLARLPWLVFGLLPLAVLTILSAASVLILTMIADGYAHSGSPLAAPLWFRELTLGAVFIGNWFLPPLAAGFFAVLAHRQRMPAHWPFIAGAVLTVIGFHMQASFPAPGLHGGSLGIGLSFPGGQDGMHLSRWLLQLLLTLTPALFYWGLRRPSALSVD